MKFHGVQIQEGSSISNLTVASGTAFPGTPNEAEMFYRTDSDIRVRGLYAYIGGNWDRIASADAVTVPSAANFPSVANTGDLFYKDSNDVNEALYVYTGSVWSPAASGSGSTATVTGDVTGTLTVGGSGALTLATVVGAATIGSAANSTIITYDAKGRITGSSTTPIAIGATQVTTGSFSDALIAQSNVTQHQSALSIGTSQTTSGTFADARIAASNVTQHQAALTILETQITNGALLARVGDNETITGAWQFNNALPVGTPSSSSHATTKAYVDAAINGLSWKNPVIAATTANITLSGAQTIDGVAVIAGQRVLVKNQSTQSQNGVYVVAAGAWTRAADFDQVTPADEVNSAAVFVQGGSLQADSAWTQTAPVASIGVDAMVFSQFAAGGLIGGGGLTLTGNQLDIGTASSARIVINTDNIDLATVTNSGTGTFQKLTTDGYGRVTGTASVTAADITALTDATYVNVTGDTMTGALNVTTTASIKLQLGNGIQNSNTIRLSGALALFDIGTTANGIEFTTPNNQPFIWSNNAAERMRIDSSGNVGIGTNNPNFQFDLQGTGGSPMALTRFGAFPSSTSISLQHSRGATVGSNVILQANDIFGSILFAGANGTGYDTGAMIRAEVDGTPGATNDMPGRLMFHTTPDGSSGALERMRIDAAGIVTVFGDAVNLRTTASTTAGYSGLRINDNAGIRKVELVHNGSTGPGAYGAPAGAVVMNASGSTPMYFSTADTARMIINTSGEVGIGIAPTSTVKLQVNVGINQNVGIITQSSLASVCGFTDAGSSTGLRLVGNPLYFSGNGSTDQMTLTATGNLGVGVTPTARFHVKAAGQLALFETTAARGAGNAYIEFKDTTGLKGFFGYGGSSDNIAIYNYNTPGDLLFGTANAERMRIDSNGTITTGGVFTTTNVINVNVAGTVPHNGIVLEGSGVNAGDISPGIYFSASNQNAAIYSRRYSGYGGEIIFATQTAGSSAAPSEKMLLTAAGALILGNSAANPPGLLYLRGASGTRPSIIYENNGVNYWNVSLKGDAGQNYYQISNGTESVGVYMTTTASGWNNLSDERFKTNLTPITGAVAKIDTLRAVTYKWLADSTLPEDVGLIAQDVLAVLPQAVDQSDPDKLGLRYSAMIPLLVAAVKELSATNATLLARIEALEAK